MTTGIDLELVRRAASAADSSMLREAIGAVTEQRRRIEMAAELVRANQRNIELVTRMAPALANPAIYGLVKATIERGNRRRKRLEDARRVLAESGEAHVVGPAWGPNDYY